MNDPFKNRLEEPAGIDYFKKMSYPRHTSPSGHFNPSRQRSIFEDLYANNKVYDRAFSRYSSEAVDAFFDYLQLLRPAIRFNERKPVYFWNKETLGELAELAKTLKSKYPDTRFYGIGHSPSYLIYGIQHLSNTLNDSAAETGYVPYSARYLRDKAGFRASSYTYTEDRASGMFRTAQLNQELYRAYLEALGLHPQKIIGDYARSGQKTAIVDNMQSGTGFASFIHFMQIWARDFQITESALAEALECIALTDQPMPRSISIPDTMDSIKVTPVRISSQLRYAINGNLSADTDRFVPRYDPQQWRRLPRTNALRANDENVAKVKQMVADAIDGKLDTLLELESPENKIDEMYFEKAKVELEEARYADALKSLAHIKDCHPLEGFNEVKEAARNGLDDDNFSKAQNAVSDGKYFDAFLYLLSIRNKDRFENFAEMEKAVRDGKDDTYFEDAKSALEKGKPRKACDHLNSIADPERFEHYNELKKKAEAALSAAEKVDEFAGFGRFLWGRDVPSMANKLTVMPDPLQPYYKDDNSFKGILEESYNPRPLSRYWLLKRSL